MVGDPRVTNETRSKETVRANDERCRVWTGVYRFISDSAVGLGYRSGNGTRVHISRHVCMVEHHKLLFAASWLGGD